MFLHIGQLLGTIALGCTLTPDFLLSFMLCYVSSIFTSQGLVISYHYTILQKVGIPIILFNRPAIKVDLSLLKENKFFLEMESENCSSTELRLKRSF